MPTNLLLDELVTVRTAVQEAVKGGDGFSALGEVDDFLCDTFPGEEKRWLSSLSQIGNGYAISLARESVGVVTHAIVYVSAAETLYTAAVSEGMYANQEKIERNFKLPLPRTDVFWQGALPGSARVLVDLGYTVRTPVADVVGLIDVAVGAAAGFVGAVVDPVVRLAGALLVAEAWGQVGDWSGRCIGPHGHSIVAGSHIVHFQRLARLVSDVAREAADV